MCVLAKSRILYCANVVKNKLQKLMTTHLASEVDSTVGLCFILSCNFIQFSLLNQLDFLNMLVLEETYYERFVFLTMK